jgi:HAE1 family hydrophobic/amphiphilic exporter-1
MPEAVTLITEGGGGGNNYQGGGGGGGSTHRGQIRIMLKPRDQRTRTNEEISVALRRQLSAKLPGVVVRANPSGGNNQIMRFLSGGGQNNQGGSSRLQLEIRGHDLDDARRLAQDARAMMEDTDGIADVQIGREEGRPEIAVRVDRPKAAMLGMSIASVANTIQTNVAGTTAAQFRERGNEYPVVVRLREEDREAISDVGDVLLSTPTGQVVPAKNVLLVNRESGPVQIQRKNMERVTSVNAEIEGSAQRRGQERRGAARSAARAAGLLGGLRPGARSRRDRSAQLRLVLILAVLLVYAVMASQCESLRDRFIIMFSVPVAAIGVVRSLLLTGTSFSMQATIGIIMLAGIVVSNAILLVDYINTLRRRDVWSCGKRSNLATARGCGRF